MKSRNVAIPKRRLETVNGFQAARVYLEAKKEAPQRMFAKMARATPDFKNENKPFRFWVVFFLL